MKIHWPGSTAAEVVEEKTMNIKTAMEITQCKENREDTETSKTQRQG
jgi:hypothetical protein